MNRRDLLAGLATAPVALAGCAGVVGPCSDASLANASVEVEYWCDYGSSPQVGGTVRADGCEGELALAVEQGGYRDRSVSREGDGVWRFSGESLGGGIGPGEARVQVVDADDRVLAEERVEVDHYRDRSDLLVRDATIEPETPAVGDTVTVTFELSNMGGDTAFTAELLVDGEPVDSLEGTVEGVASCTATTGPRRSLSHAFAEAGEYDVAVELEPHSEGSGDRWDAGTVTVRDA